jgi:hypothetical protein
MNANALLLKRDPIAFQMALEEVDISISGYFYAVDFGSGVRPQHHRVDTQNTCSCYLGEFCPAVDAVRAYLESGGEPAVAPPPGYFPVVPSKCPACGAPTLYDARLNSKQRGIGWRCIMTGTEHYWDTMGKALAQKFARKWAMLAQGQQNSQFHLTQYH